MVYFTVYLKNLNNGTGYVDTALADDQLMRDFLQYLDIGVKAHRAYAVVDAAASDQPVGIVHHRDASIFAPINASTHASPGFKYRKYFIAPTRMK